MNKIEKWAPTDTQVSVSANMNVAIFFKVSLRI